MQQNAEEGMKAASRQSRRGRKMQVKTSTASANVSVSSKRNVSDPFSPSIVFLTGENLTFSKPLVNVSPSEAYSP